MENKKMNFDEIFSSFGKGLGRLKEAYAQKYNCDSEYLQIIINDNNYVTIIPTNETGNYIQAFNEWVDTE